MTLPDSFKYSPHLTFGEIKCKCGKCDGGFIVPELAVRFERLRELCSKIKKREVRLIVNSGYRCPKHNSRVAKTGKNGPHTRGIALDIRCPEGFTMDEFHACCLVVFADGGVGFYPEDNFIHNDVRGEKARW